MQLIDHDADGATLRLDQKELLMMYALVQEGRIVFECDSPRGLAIEKCLQGAAMRIAKAQKPLTIVRP